jgi:hypothetical protein
MGGALKDNNVSAPHLKILMYLQTTFAADI